MVTGLINSKNMRSSKDYSGYRWASLPLLFLLFFPSLSLRISLSLFFHLAISLFSCLSLSLFMSVSLIMSVSLCSCLSFSFLGVGVSSVSCWCVLVCVCVCAWHAENLCVWIQNASVCGFKTPPCVDSKRLRVCWQNAQVTQYTSVSAAYTETC